MIPFERAIYVQMLMDWIEKENERVRQENERMNRKTR